MSININNITIPGKLYTCNEVLYASDLDDSLFYPLCTTINAVNLIISYINDLESNWINSEESPGEEISLNSTLLSINGLSDADNNSILFYNNNWDYKILSDSVVSLLDLQNPSGSGKILYYDDNTWKYTDLPTAGISLTGLLNDLKNDDVDNINKGSNKVLVYNDGTWSYLPYVSSGGSVDLSGYTWWGRSIDGTSITGDLSGNIKLITFLGSEGKLIYLGLDANNNLRLSASTGAAIFYATGGISALGTSTGGGSSSEPSGGIDLTAVWNSLRNNVDDFSNVKIDSAHIPALGYVSNSRNGANFDVPSNKSAGNYTLVTSDDISSFATQSWVNSQGFLKQVDSSIYATLSWANQTFLRSAVTSIGISPAIGSNITILNSPVTTSGTITIGLTNGYSIPTTAKQTVWDNKQDAINDLSTIRTNSLHGETAYGWGNHANAGYVTLTTAQTISGLKTFSVGPILNNNTPLRVKDSNGTIYNTFELDNNNTFAIGYGIRNLTGSNTSVYGNQTIKFNLNGSVFSKISSEGLIIGNDGNENSDITHFILIGGGKICWDNNNNALYVLKSDGTAANLYATGGVGALGVVTNEITNLTSLTLGTLNVTGTSTLTRANISKITNDTIEASSNGLQFMNAVGNKYLELWINGLDDNYIGFNSTNIHGLNSSATETWKITSDGEAVFDFLKIGNSGSNIHKIYWDGSYLLILIGAKIYKFVPDIIANA